MGRVVGKQKKKKEDELFFQVYDTQLSLLNMGLFSIDTEGVVNCISNDQRFESSTFFKWSYFFIL